MTSRTVVLLGGPSGSGKTRLARLSGLPNVRLDDFYLSEAAPNLPRNQKGEIVWDDPRTWDAAGAARAITELAHTGSAIVPSYVISLNRAIGTHEIDLTEVGAFIVEGIFTIELLALLRPDELNLVPIWLDRPRITNWYRRLRRDLYEHRKPVPVLLRRGIDLFRIELRLRQRAVRAGFIPLSMADATQRLQALAL